MPNCTSRASVTLTLSRIYPPTVLAWSPTHLTRRSHRIQGATLELICYFICYFYVCRGWGGGGWCYSHALADKRTADCLRKRACFGKHGTVRWARASCGNVLSHGRPERCPSQLCENKPSSYVSIITPAWQTEDDGVLQLKFRVLLNTLRKLSFCKSCVETVGLCTHRRHTWESDTRLPGLLFWSKEFGSGERKLILATWACIHSVGLQKVKYRPLTYILYVLDAVE